MPSVMFLYLMAHDLHQFPQLFLINVLYLSHTIIIPKLANKKKRKERNDKCFWKNSKNCCFVKSFNMFYSSTINKYSSITQFLSYLQAHMLRFHNVFFTYMPYQRFSTIASSALFGHITYHIDPQQYHNLHHSYLYQS